MSQLSIYQVLATSGHDSYIDSSTSAFTPKVPTHTHISHTLFDIILHRLFLFGIPASGPRLQSTHLLKCMLTQSFVMHFFSPHIRRIFCHLGPPSPPLRPNPDITAPRSISELHSAIIPFTTSRSSQPSMASQFTCATCGHVAVSARANKRHMAATAINADGQVVQKCAFKPTEEQVIELLDPFRLTLTYCSAFSTTVLLSLDLLCMIVQCDSIASSLKRLGASRSH